MINTTITVLVLILVSCGSVQMLVSDESGISERDIKTISRSSNVTIVMQLKSGVKQMDTLLVEADVITGDRGKYDVKKHRLNKFSKFLLILSKDL